MKLDDLKGASYNPRQISSEDLKKLARSLAKYGDLSGVVFNKKTGVLISGHQRLKSMRLMLSSVEGLKEKIVVSPVTDSKGTVGVGSIVLYKGTDPILSTPLRLVSWSDKTQEMAANIAANNLGGNWDKEKLRKVLAKLSDQKFEVESIGFDQIFVDDFLNEVKSKEFAEVELDKLSNANEVCCPKCKFVFDPKFSNSKSKAKVHAETRKK